MYMYYIIIMSTENIFLNIFSSVLWGTILKLRCRTKIQTNENYTVYCEV